MAEEKSAVPGGARRWAPSRIASAAVLTILVLGGIAYGIYSLTSSSSPVANNSPKSSQLTAPNPKPKASSKSSAGSASSSSNSSNGSSKSAGSSSATSTSAGSNGQLSNTGPGNTALIGFVVAVVLGSLGHYSWRRYRSTS